jgi:hypothetical protein
MSAAVGRRGPRDGSIDQRQVDRWTAAAFDRRTPRLATGPATRSALGSRFQDLLAGPLYEGQDRLARLGGVRRVSARGSALGPPARAARARPSGRA